MINVINILQSAIICFGALLLNKGSSHIYFIYLLALLSLWLLVHTLVVNKILKGVFVILQISIFGSVLAAIKTKSLLLFFVFFEISALPITMIVFLFGYQPEKIQASLFLVLYTVLGRLPLLLFIISGYYPQFTGTFLLSIPITLGFMVKTPIFILHIWLPKAHVQAPVGGSMVLSGVLLKLGSYGLLLFIPLIKLNLLMVFYFVIALLGSILGSLICFRQGDIKIVIAYSSIVHMGAVTLGFVRGTELGYRCRLLMVLGHGLRSPFLFAFSYWLYASTHTRLLTFNRINSPILTFCFLGVITLNMGVPPRICVWAEVFMTIITLKIRRITWPLLIAVFLFGALYNLYLYTSISHSKNITTLKSLGRERIIARLQVVFLGYFAFFSLDLFHSFEFFFYWDPHQYTLRNKINQTTSTKCQYHALASKPKWCSLVKWWFHCRAHIEAMNNVPTTTCRPWNPDNR